MDATILHAESNPKAGPRARPGSLVAGRTLHAVFLAALVLGGISAAEPSIHAPVDSATVPAPAELPAPEAAPATAAASEPVKVAVQAAPVPDPALTSNAYTIVAGDTIGAVAARYGVDVSGMLAANGLAAHSTIVPGQVVKFTGPPVPVTPAQAPAPAGRVIYLAGSGGQELIDRCAGPTHFTPITESMSITEHDYCGGWARFSGIQVGETVTISGVGTYTATGRGSVPRGGNMSHVRALLGGTPPVFLQTCIPGTDQMLVIGLG